MNDTNALTRALTDDTGLVTEWMEALSQSSLRTEGLVSDHELREEAQTLVRLLAETAGGGEEEWEQLLESMDGLARARVEQGFEPADTTDFIQALRGPLLRRVHERSADGGVDDVLRASKLLDLALQRMMDAYVKARDAIIAQQQEDLLELSTPVMSLWDGVLALPLIGTLDSRRAMVVMEAMLSRIAETGSRIAILDITGVPTVDTLVAQHLIKTVTAARLMGAECILSGIRPQIAQTLVQLGVTLGDIDTRATLADAFAAALRRLGVAVSEPEVPH
jgi:rsbT co-antagonist protein RsbR